MLIFNLNWRVSVQECFDAAAVSLADLRAEIFANQST